MRIACICGKPFQLFNIINYISQMTNEEDTIDLYINVSCFNDKTLENLKRERFSNILYYEAILDNDYIKYYYILISLFYPSFVLKKLVLNYDSCPVHKYDRILISHVALFPYAFIQRNSENADVVILEDGIGTYVRTDQKSLKFKIIWLVLWNRKFRSTKSMISNRFVYRPEWLLWSQSDLSSEWIHCLQFDLKHSLTRLKELFNYEYPAAYINAKLIYFEQNGNSFLSSSVGTKVMRIIHCATQGRYVRRKHPGMLNDNEIILDEHFDAGEQNWELLANDISEDMILVSVNSTASIIPFEIYKKRNPCIFIYKLAEGKSKWDLQFDTFIHEKTIFENANIYTPCSIYEFKELLERLLKRNGCK